MNVCRDCGTEPPTERDAFASWIEHRADSLARRYPPWEREDVKQAAWWGAVCAFDAYVPSPGGALLPFVLQRMRWAAVDHLRASSEFARGAGAPLRAVPCDLSAADVPYEDPGFEAVEEAALGAWAVSAARPLFEGLATEDQRHVAVRRYLHGANNPTIAAELGVTIPRIAQLAKPARTLLATLNVA